MWHAMFIEQIPVSEKILRTVIVYAAIAVLFRLTGLPVHRPLVLSAAHGENDGMPQRTSLDALAREQLGLAAGAGGGHTAHTVYGGREKVLRQTAIAMVHGSELSEHENPGEATVLVLHGRVRMSAGDLAWEGSRGDLITVPDTRHRLKALEDSAVLLTVAKLP